MNRSIKRITTLLLSAIIITAYYPAGMAWAVSDAANEEDMGAAGTPAASASEPEEEQEQIPESPDDNEMQQEEMTPAEIDNETDDAFMLEQETIVNEDENIDTDPDIERNQIGITADPDITGGAVILVPGEEGSVQGEAVPEEGYDLATIRQKWTDESGSEREQYLNYTYTEGHYLFEATETGFDSFITAYFYDLNKWDGAVDLSWYDPDETEYEISTPAQLAGLAAITNGTVDENVTEEYMIKDNDGREYDGENYTHRYVSSEPATVDLLTPNASEGAGQVRDTAWRLPEVEHRKVGNASDDVHNDFLYRTVRITSDLDMGDVNWTPIGGKYAMNRDALNGTDAHVIDTRFQGVLDGQGHTVTITCDRQAKMGFAYAMEIALVGYLGGGVDYKNGYPKDTYMDYENYWVPTVRNIVVRGDVKGRRMVSGVVGRTGETNYGVLVENCANYASVSATDMRGCAGIVGAAWGKTIIRNCYNAGTIHSNYWEHGGIVGSNGYEGSEGRNPAGADIYNCYNVGETAKFDQASKTWKYDGQEIGVDGEAFAGYKVANCYYLAPESILEDKTGYSVGSTSKNRRAKVIDVNAADLRSDEVLAALNVNGDAFARDTENINNGYPILFFQTKEYQDAHGNMPHASVTLQSSNNEAGSISSSDNLNNIPYGTNIDLTVTAAKGYKFTHCIIDNGTDEWSVLHGGYVCVTGQDMTVTAVFAERSATPVVFAEQEDGEDYYIKVTKIYDGNLEETCSIPVASNDELNYNDWIKIEPVMKPLNTVHPDIKNLEYTGKFGDPIFTENSLEKVPNRTGIYSVTGETEIIELSFKPKTQGKRWTTMADTSWYKDGTKTFTLTNARQLAGVAKLCMSGKDFAGVTIKMGNDIGLENTLANSGDEYGYERSWIGIGNDAHPFKGTFDGQGHSVKCMHRNFASGYSEGSNGGLFGVTEGAVIRNVTIEGGSYINDYNVEMACGFINGANGGAIVGDAIDTVIENCRANVPMEKAFNAGGIAGELEGKSIIRNCSSDCVISGTGESIGGIAGKLSGAKDAVIEDCTNNGDITSTKWKIGGILGSGETSSAAITRCINNGSITTEMKGASSAVHAAGGVIGYAAGTVTCSESINRGDITGKLQTVALGGVAGTILKGTLTNCYNTGRIHSDSTSKYAQISGIVNLGTNKSNIASVSNCYNSGEITVGEDFIGTAKGGVIGYGNAEFNVIKNAVCSESAAAGIDGTAGAAGTVIGDDELKGYSPTLGQAFVRDLEDINGGFPVLVWQTNGLVGKVTMSKVSRSTDTALIAYWKVTGNNDGIELYRSTSKSSGYSKVYTGKAVSYKSTKLKYGKTYYFKARAYRTIDGAKYYGDWSGIKSYSLVPSKPTLSSVKNSKAKTAVIKWKKVSGVTGYEIYRSTKKSSGFKKIATIKKAGTVSYTDKKLKKGKTYYYKVRSYKKVGSNTGYSAYSAVKYAKIKK